MILQSNIEGEKEMYKLKDKIHTNPREDKEFCALVFVALSPEVYDNPEQIADNLAKFREVESVDVVAGKWGLVLKITTIDKDSFYDFLKKKIYKERGIMKINCVISLKKIKPIFYAQWKKGKKA